MSIWRNRDNIVFFLLIIAHLIPIWLFNYFPSQDGPSHIANANIIKEYHLPERSIFRKYYVFNTPFAPTWLVHLILAGLMCMVPILVAQKIFLSCYVVLFPISVLYALGAIRSDTRFLAFLSFPFIYNYFLHMGFYSFSCSLPLFFFLIGYWLKSREQYTPRNILILVLLSLFLYCFHIVSLIMAFVWIAIFTMWLILLDLIQYENCRKISLIVFWKSFKKRILPIPIILLPPFIFLYFFLTIKGDVLNLLPLLRNLIQIEPLVSYQRMEIWISLALGSVFWVLLLYTAISKELYRNLDLWDGFLFILIAYVLMYFMIPNRFLGLSFISIRLNIYPFFVLMIWFGAQSYNVIVKRLTVIVTIAIALTSLSLHTMKYAELNDYLKEYLSGMQLIESNTTLLPIIFSSKGHTPDGKTLSLKVKPFALTSGYIAAKRGVVDFTNYEAGATYYFPIIFRQNLNPFKHIARKPEGWKLIPPNVEFLSYPKRTGGQLDYVLVWGIKDNQHDHEATRSIFRQLKEGYQLIYISSKRGLMKLYRRKNFDDDIILKQ